jgi:hypothetical protein
MAARRTGIDHDADERALAQLSEHEAEEKRVFRACGPCEQVLQRLCSLRRRAGSAHTDDRREAVIDVGNRQGPAVDRRIRCGRPQHRRADADAALGHFSREKLNGRFDLCGRQCPQKPGQRPHLGRSRSACRHALRRVYQVGEKGHRST